MAYICIYTYMRINTFVCAVSQVFDLISATMFGEKIDANETLAERARSRQRHAFVYV